MRTDDDIRESLRARAEDAAPVDDVLARLLGAERRPRRIGRMHVNLRVAAASAAVLVVAAATLAIVRHEDRVRHEAAPIGSQPRWPDSYTFSSDSLPRYTMTRTDIQIPGRAPSASTTYTYTKGSENMQATLTVLPASKLGRYRDGTPVKVNGKRGYYQAGSASLPPPPPRPTSAQAVPAPTGSRAARPLVPALSSAIVWPISNDSWAVLTVGPASSGSNINQPEADTSKAAMVDLAESVRLRESPTVAPVKVGYLPANLELSSVQQFLQNPANTFDNRFGRSYRDLMFVDRSASRSQLFSLDVGVLVAPQKPLELKDLPDARTAPSGNWSPRPYDPAKQWTQTTIAGHRAFVSAHDVIVDWGTVEVHVTNENFPYAVKPVLSQHELIRIAASLTVPPSGTTGNGYPLSQAVPAANLH
jgi:hypothetical protein